MANKKVAATQRAVDKLALDSGAWSVRGCPGLYVRALKKTKTYFVQRRVRGRLIKRGLGALSMKDARSEASRIWNTLAPRATGTTTLTLRDAIDSYIERERLATSSKALYRNYATRCLGDWLDRRLSDIGTDRWGVDQLYKDIRNKHGAAVANGALRLLGGAYNWCRRKYDPWLPESPTTAIDFARIPPRDSALSDDELRAMWVNVSKLTPVKQAVWTLLLLTGARSGSACAMRWEHVDLELKVILFATAKGDHPYSVPAADRLIEYLKEYREKAIPGPWVFPSRTRPGEHLSSPRSYRDGVTNPHALRHTYRTALVGLGATEDVARLLLGHSLTGNVSRSYISTGLLIEPLRPFVEAVADRYVKVLGAL